MKIYACDACGKLVMILKEGTPETICCGKPMHELRPGTTDGMPEKHVPVYTVNGTTVTVKVGSAEHPMLPAHHIEWIALETENGCQCRHLKSASSPRATFELTAGDKVTGVYAYCNLHGLWKA